MRVNECKNNNQILNLQDNTNEIDFFTNLPKCPYCKKLSRPAILMFDDCEWIAQSNFMWIDWQQTVNDIINKETQNSLCILELGCGKNVPTLREKSEQLLNEMPNTKLIRINPFEPEADSQIDLTKFLSINNGALSALESIDYFISKIN
eukprot:TRINITY_DN14_c0_g2_i1.p1 TRINITY_DN14_c0_g2~~TRINITY_DN14_c0_g2_i1.p1  ORF type:complete len:149 (-),score=44.70 TRINITY_DN14_c0_g2_i1:15-461(-)